MPGSIYLGDHIVPKLQTLIFAPPPGIPVLSGAFHPDVGNSVTLIVEEWEATLITGDDSFTLSIGNSSDLIITTPETCEAVDNQGTAYLTFP